MSKYRKQAIQYLGRVQHAATLPRPRRWPLLVLASVVSLICFVATGFALVNSDLNSHIKSLSGAQTLLDRTPPDSYTGRALNILVIGTDSRAGEGNATITNNDDVTQRSDTTMLVHVAKDRSRVQVVSIQRDTKVDIPACKRTDGTSSHPQPHTQFNWAFSRGGGDRGEISSALACTWKTVENMTGLTVDEAVIVDFNGFQHMINALGGINVYVPTQIKDAKNSGIVIDQPGCMHFNGEQALGYARVRKGIKGGDGSDWQRIERQQEVMGIMLRTALDKNVMSNIGSLYAFLRAGLSSLHVSNGFDSTSKMAGFGWTLRNIRPENLQFVMMPAYDDPVERYRLLIDEKKAKPLWKALKEDKPFPVGMQIRDGNGNIYLVKDPSELAADKLKTEQKAQDSTEKKKETVTSNSGQTLEKVTQRVPKGSELSSGEELELAKQKCYEKHFN